MYKGKSGREGRHILLENVDKFLSPPPKVKRNRLPARIEHCSRERTAVVELRCRATRTASAGQRSAAEPLLALPPLQLVRAYPQTLLASALACSAPVLCTPSGTGLEAFPVPRRRRAIRSCCRGRRQTTQAASLPVRLLCPCSTTAAPSAALAWHAQTWDGGAARDPQVPAIDRAAD